ncbi:MAG TPA: PAS domain S-box protein [Bryobacteraceae bacterium]|nr:PAS domain S-box protein [Bryobacteraceae bacterium]
MAASEKRNSKILRPYLIALATLIPAVLITFTVTRTVGFRPHPAIGFSYLLSILASAWWGGYGPGLLSCLVSFFVVPYLFLPKFSPAAVDPARFLLTVLIAMLVSRMADVRRRTERKLREANEELGQRIHERTAELQQARDWLHTTLASIGDGVIATDTAGLVTFANHVAGALTGWPEDRTKGCPVTEIFVVTDEKTGARLECLSIEVLRTGVATPSARRSILRTSDGREIPIDESASPIRESGRIIGVVIVFRDMRSRREAEQALERSEERLRLALEAGRIGAWDWDIQRNTIEWSKRVYEIHGVSPGAFAGAVEDFIRLVHPEDLSRVQEQITQALERDTPYQIEFRVIHPGGAVRWVATTARVLRDDRQQPVRMLGATTDVTERKQIEEQLARTNASLQRSNEDLRQFTYSASHDLQEPLRSVTAYAELVNRSYGPQLDNKGSEYLGHIFAGAQQLQQLLAALREYWGATQYQECSTPADTEQVLKAALANLHAAIETSGAGITHDPLPPVYAHEVGLLQLFQNLIGNAIKYRGEQPPVIHVGVIRNGPQCIFSIRDNGAGFDPRYKDQVFEVFQRLAGREIAGTGMGLSICKKLVEHYGGAIWAESAPGAGSTFSFTLRAAGPPSLKA